MMEKIFIGIFTCCLLLMPMCMFPLDSVSSSSLANDDSSQDDQATQLKQSIGQKASQKNDETLPSTSGSSDSTSINYPTYNPPTYSDDDDDIGGDDDDTGGDDDDTGGDDDDTGGDDDDTGGDDDDDSPFIWGDDDDDDDDDDSDDDDDDGGEFIGDDDEGYNIDNDPLNIGGNIQSDYDTKSAERNEVPPPPDPPDPPGPPDESASSSSAAEKQEVTQEASSAQQPAAAQQPAGAQVPAGAASPQENSANL